MLHPDHIGDTPFDDDWEGYPERWDYFDARRCNEFERDDDEEECEGFVVGGFMGTCDTCGRDVEEVSEGPMMSYAYPCDINEAVDAAIKLVDLPLCIITYEDGRTALTLTGGGTDLSWEIAEAYIRLGYAPPLHFVENLPRMTGRDRLPSTRVVLDGARRTVEFLKDRLESTRRRLDQLEPDPAWAEVNDLESEAARATELAKSDLGSSKGRLLGMEVLRDLRLIKERDDLDTRILPRIEVIRRQIETEVFDIREET